MARRYLVRGSLVVVAAFVGCNVYDSSLLTGGDDGATETGGQAGSLGSGGNSGSGGSPSSGGSTGLEGGTGSGTGGTVSPEGGAGGEDNPTGGATTGGATTGGSDTGGAAGTTTGGASGTAGNAGAGTSGMSGAGGGGAGAGGAGNAGMAGAGAGGMAGASGGGGTGGAPIVQLTGTATADSEQTNPVHPATHGNDGMTGTRWCAANGSTGHYWTLDLGSVHPLSRFEVMWEYPNQAMGLSYGYLVSVSDDGTTFTPSIDRRASTEVTQTQTSDFPPSTSGRYVRITITSLPASMPQPTWASFWEARVFGQ